MEEKYIPAGHASTTGILTTLAIGIIASILLPLFYIILAQLIPNIWFIAICAFSLGMLLGLAIDQGIRIGKIRNLKVALTIAAGCSLLAFYVQWVFFDAVIYSRRGFTFNQSMADFRQLVLDMAFLFVHPGVLFKEVMALNNIGTFRIEGSDNISGLLLWVIWAGEFLVITGGTILIAWNGQVKTPYSELNDQWMQRRTPNLLIPFVQDKEHLLNQLKNKNFEVLKNNSAAITHPDYAEVVVYESIGDPTKFITVLNVTAPAGKNKQARKKVVFAHYPLPNNAAI